MIPIPGSGKNFKLTNTGDILGQIVNGRNLDFDKKGYLSLARRVLALYSEKDDADFGTPVSIVGFEGNYVVITENDVYRLDPTSPLAAVENLTFGGGSDFPATNLGSDAVVFMDQVLVSGGTTLNTYDDVQDWNEEVTGLGSGVPHPLCVVEHIPGGRVAVGDGNEVKYYDAAYDPVEGSGGNDLILVLPPEYVVVWIRWKDNKLYIGTRNTTGKSAKMFVTDGASTSAESGWNVNASWIFSGTEYDSAMCVITSTGELLRFNGGGFTQLDALPVYYSPYQWRMSAGLVGAVCQRGMTADGERLFLVIDGQLDISQYETEGKMLNNQPSGLWVRDPNAGLYHRAGATPIKYRTPTVSVLASDTLTVPTGHLTELGEAVFVRTVGSLTGLTGGRTYYSIPVSGTTLKLALTPADALSGDAVTIGGSVAGAALAFNTPDIIGSVQDINPGAIHVLSPIAPFTFYGTDVLFGAKSNDDAGTAYGSLMSLGLGRNIGSFEIARIFSQEVTDVSQKFFAKFRGMFLPSDSITTKFRIEDRFGMPTPTAWGDLAGYATWIDPKTFTVDPASKGFSQVEEGDEIEIITGSAAGYVGTVASIDMDVTPYVIVLEENVPQIHEDDVSDVIANNWITLAKTTTDTPSSADGYLEDDISESSKWVQPKVQMEGFEVRIEEMQLVNETNAESA